MRIACIFLLLVMAGFSSCQWGVPHNHKPAITKDTLKYTYQTIKERAADCGNKPDSACTVAKITYPIITAQQSLNDTITARLLSAYHNNEKSDSNLLQQAKNFIKVYEADTVKEHDKFDFESSATVIRQDSSIITIEINRYSWTDGGHASDYTGFINWNTKNNKEIELADILKDGYSNNLNAIAESIFRKDEKLSATESLAKDYLFKNGKFSLNYNFLITPTGLRFLYNEYEIKPYAAGQTDLVIPYTEIKSLLKPNTVISQYIK